MKEETNLNSKTNKYIKIQKKSEWKDVIVEGTEKYRKNRETERATDK